MAKPLSVISFQSHVALGHVGNSAAVFALQRLGIEVWPVHTLQFGHHPGLGPPGGGTFDAKHLNSVVDSLHTLGTLAACNGVLSGYLGRAETAGVVRRAVDLAKAANPAIPYFCDPAFGDRETGVFTADGVAARVADTLIPVADIVCPNAFELSHLTGLAVDDEAGALAAARALLERGPSLVVVTGLADGTVEAERIVSLALARDGAWRVAVPALELGRRADGAGDLFAAMFFADYLAAGRAGRALGRAASVTHGVLSAWERRGGRHLPLVAAQDEIVRPSVTFIAERISEKS